MVQHDAQMRSDRLRHLILQPEYIGSLHIKGGVPQQLAISGANQAGVHAQAITGLLPGSVQHGCHRQRLASRSGIRVERRVAAHSSQRPHRDLTRFAQLADDGVGQPQAEQVLRTGRRQWFQRQHSDRADIHRHGGQKVEAGRNRRP